MIESKKNIGLFPLGAKCENIKTKGLKWNLENDLNYLEFGKFTSSSNEAIDDQIHIENSSPIILTTGILEIYQLINRLETKVSL
jgi:thiamine pyrophosphokinase